MRLAKLHSTDKTRRWFRVDFVVGGMGFNEDIACKLGAQVRQPFEHDVVVSIMLDCTDALSTCYHQINDDMHMTCT